MKTPRGWLLLSAVSLSFPPEAAWRPSRWLSLPGPSLEIDYNIINTPEPFLNELSANHFYDSMAASIISIFSVRESQGTKEKKIAATHEELTGSWNIVKSLSCFLLCLLLVIMDLSDGERRQKRENLWRFSPLYLTVVMVLVVVMVMVIFLVLLRCCCVALWWFSVIVLLGGVWKDGMAWMLTPFRACI